jgi:hypothetical protein
MKFNFILFFYIHILYIIIMPLEKTGCTQGSPNCIRQTSYWGNCVVWGETQAGKHDDWCVNDFGPGWTHTGQGGDNCAPGWGKGDCSTFKYIGPNCENWDSDEIWSPACDGNTKIFPNLNSTRKTYCNSNQERANGVDCAKWCNDNNGQCSVKGQSAKCVKYGIWSSVCNDNTINDIESKCVNMGFIDQTTKSAIGTAVCNKDSIGAFLDECLTYIPEYIASESGCTSVGLADAKARKLIAETAEKNRLQLAQDVQAARISSQKGIAQLITSQKQSDITRKEDLEKVSTEQIAARKDAQLQMEKILLSVVDPDAIPDGKKGWFDNWGFGDGKDNTTMYIIIAIIVFLLITSSSVALLLI